MTPENWIEIAVAATIPLAIISVTINRLHTKRGIGVRAIQFIAVATAIPAVALLSLQGKLQGEAVAAIFGGIVGYLLSNIAKFDDRDA